MMAKKPHIYSIAAQQCVTLLRANALEPMRDAVCTVKNIQIQTGHARNNGRRAWRSKGTEC
eukprot:725228-Amphidinium_carterae.2